MVKNLIRNGGFERGNTDFWKAVNMKTFEIVGPPVYKGSYAAKLVANGSQYPYAMSNDYIPLVAGEMAYFECWLRSVDTFSVSIDAVYYDEGLKMVEEISYGTVNPGTSAYKQLLRVISGIEGAMYVRPRIFMLSNTDDRYVLIDNVQMYKYTPRETISEYRRMLSESTIDSAGTFYGLWVPTAAFREAEFVLWVDACAGASETVDVTIESRTSYSSLDLDHDIATFNQITSPAQQQVLVVTAGLGTRIRAKVVIGGSPTDVDVDIFGTFKR